MSKVVQTQPHHVTIASIVMTHATIPSNMLLHPKKPLLFHVTIGLSTGQSDIRRRSGRIKIVRQTPSIVSVHNSTLAFISVNTSRPPSITSLGTIPQQLRTRVFRDRLGRQSEEIDVGLVDGHNVVLQKHTQLVGSLDTVPQRLGILVSVLGLDLNHPVLKLGRAELLVRVLELMSRTLSFSGDLYFFAGAGPGVRPTCMFGTVL